MSRYLLFAGMDFYASGGANDFLIGLDEPDAADRHLPSTQRATPAFDEQGADANWAHLFDTETLTTIKQWYRATGTDRWIDQTNIEPGWANPRGETPSPG